MYTAKLTYKMDETNAATIEFAINDYYVNINSNGSSCRFHLPNVIDAKIEELIGDYPEITLMEIYNNANKLVYSSTYWGYITGFNSQTMDENTSLHELYFAHEDNRFIEA